MKHDLHLFLEGISETIGAEYRRIHRRSTEDPGTAGDQGEENWAEIIRAWVPSYYRVVTKGRIINPEGNVSPQVDILVLTPEYPPALINKKLYLSNGVAAAFECKNTLKGADIRKTLQNSIAVKSLYQRRTGSVQDDLTSPIIYGLLAHSYSWKSSPQAVKARIATNLSSAESLISHPRELVDMLCVANLGVWFKQQMVEAEICGWDLKVTTRIGYVSVDRPREVPSGLEAPYDESFPACGPFVSSLLYRLSQENSRLNDIGKYFMDTGFPGMFGDWVPLDFDAVPLISPSGIKELVAGALETTDGQIEVCIP